jgi:hypothetical protein
MIGPPLRKLSIRKFPVGAGPCGIPGEAEAAGEVAAAGEALPLNVTGTLEPGAGEPATPVVGAPGAALIPGATEAPGALGDIAAPGVPGDVAAPGMGGSCWAGAAGLPGAAGFVIGGGF